MNRYRFIFFIFIMAAAALDVSAQADRLAALDEVTRDMLMEITKDDVDAASRSET